jgi:glycosyltransferase involved in cell wall biosynthesis
VPRGLPSFDLVVATVGRAEELGRLFDSLEAQSHQSFRVVVVDQNEDDRVDPVLAGRRFDVLHLRSASGLSRARNTGLQHVAADVVAFPDDDCSYPPGLLERVAKSLAARPELDGVTGRVADAAGRSSGAWDRDPAVLDRSNLWNRASSATVFLRRAVVERVGAFDEQLGLGSGAPWHSGEEIDYLVRALDSGARIEYDPSLVVEHSLVPDNAGIGFRDGATVGYILRKHGYSWRTRARMLVRPIGGVLVSLGKRDGQRARFYAATFRGRLRGLRGP